MDTVGFGHNHGEDREEKAKKELRKATENGINLVILVIPLCSPRLSEMTLKCVESLKDIMGEKVLDHLLIVLNQQENVNKKIRN